MSPVRARSAFVVACVVLPCATLLAAPAARAQNGGTGDAGRVAHHGRLADPRVGYSTQGKYIERWYLERRDPNAASSDVVDPVTVLIDPDIPAAWHPYIRRGVAEWQPAFDSIGFRNVFVVRVATAADSATPPKHVVRVHKGENTGTMRQVTYRSSNNIGDLQSSDIDVNGEAYFSEAARRYCSLLTETDPALPRVCPDSLLGRYFQSAFAHEVGHALGLQHNFYAGNAYPTDSLRSAPFMHRWGSTASVMSYAEYVPFTLPEDHVSLEDRWRRVGPYDRWAIAWGYRSIPDAKTAEDELPTLERWRSAQDTASYLRYGGDMFLSRLYGPGNPGGDDALKAIYYKSLSRANAWRRGFAADSAAMFRSLAEGFQGADYPSLWQSRFPDILRSFVGARRPQAPYPRDEAAVQYAPVPAARQLEAIRFVLRQALYRQDPAMQLLDTVTGTAKLHPPGDSVPLIFDASPGSRLPDAAKWQQAQQAALQALVAALPKLPAEAQPEACRYLADGVRALTKFEAGAGASPALKTSAATLRTTLTAPPGCARP